MSLMDKCERCKKNIDFVGIIWTPEYGPLKGFRLYFDTVNCSKLFREEYYSKIEKDVGHESQCLNVT